MHDPSGVEYDLVHHQFIAFQFMNDPQINDVNMSQFILKLFI